MRIFLKIIRYKSCVTGKGIDLSKSNKNKECMICHYWFFNHGFNFQDSVCNGCHNLTMFSVNINDLAIIIFKNVDYCCIINNTSKSEAINLLKNLVTVRCFLFFY